MPRSLLNPYRHIARLCVLRNVRERLAADPVQLSFDRSRKRQAFTGPLDVDAEAALPSEGCSVPAQCREETICPGLVPELEDESPHLALSASRQFSDRAQRPAERVGRADVLTGERLLRRARVKNRGEQRL